MIEHAVAYARLGLRVLPIWPTFGETCGCGDAGCPSPGKHPIARTQAGEQLAPHGLGNATLDEATIARWWTARPDASIGVALRASGLIAFDVDKPENYPALSAAEGELGELPPTVIQRSGSGNLHLVYRAPDHPIVGTFRGVTMRAKNYIVVAPSVHKSGNRYMWEPGCAPWERPVAALPAAWLEALRKEESVETAGVPAAEPAWLVAIPQDERIRQMREHLSREDGEVKGQSDQGTAFNVTRTCARGFAIREPDLLLRVIVEDYDRKCVPPYGAERVRQRVQKVYDAATDPPWGHCLRSGPQILSDVLGSDVREHVERLRAEHAALLASVAPDVQPFYLQALADVRAALGRSDGTGRVSALFEPARALMAREFPPVPWLVRNLMKEGGTCVVGGTPKSGKSWALTEVARAVVTGTKAFGQFETGTPKRGAYFYAEDLGGDVQAHLRALARGAQLTEEQQSLMLDNLYVQPRGRFVDVARDEDLALVVASCRLRGGVDFVCLEPLRDIHSGKENESDDMAVVMKRLRVLGELLSTPERPCTVLTAHHNKKANEADRGGEAMRGSGAIHGSIDSGVYLSLKESNNIDRFVSTVESEVKGARSGGKFELTLEIKDGADDRSEIATWRFAAAEQKNDPQSTARAEDASAMAEMTAFYRKVCEYAQGGQYLTSRQWRNVFGDRKVRTWIAAMMGANGPCRLKFETIHPVTRQSVRGGGDGFLVPCGPSTL